MYFGNLLKNKNNNNNEISNSTYRFKITFLFAVFGIILITATLTMGIKSADIFAQGNNITNSTNASQSDNQTTEEEPDPRSNLTHADNTDSDGDGILDSFEISIGTNSTMPDYQNGTLNQGMH